MSKREDKVKLRRADRARYRDKRIRLVPAEKSDTLDFMWYWNVSGI
jgi:hypothetical protein